MALLLTRSVERWLLDFFGLSKGGLIEVIVSNASVAENPQDVGLKATISSHESWAAQAFKSC